MKTSYTFHHVDREVKSAIRNHFEEKLSRLVRLLHPPELEAARLRVVVRGPLDVRPRWSLRVVFTVPEATLVAEAGDYYMVRPPLDEVTEQLWKQLRAYRSARSREKERGREVAFEAPPARPSEPAGDRETFRSFAERYSPLLFEEARRWIQYLEQQGKLPRDRRSVEGVVDESLLLAWERREQRPESIDAEDWLHGVLLEVIDTAVRHVSETTPDVPRPQRDDGWLDPDPDDSQWVEWSSLQSRETAGDAEIWEDLLPDRRQAEPLRETTADEEREAILSTLAELSDDERAAFTLYVFDGYECDEIAMIQNSSVAEVREAVRAARERLAFSGESPALQA